MMQIISSNYEVEQDDNTVTILCECTAQNSEGIQYFEKTMQITDTATNMTFKNLFYDCKVAFAHWLDGIVANEGEI